MAPVSDPYRLLGIAHSASDAEIKAAHRALAKRYHPDAPQADTVRFLALQEAYQLLSDPLRRREWDARHAMGPVRAGDSFGAARRGRSRDAAGRWTSEAPEFGTRTRARGDRGAGTRTRGGGGNDARSRGQPGYGAGPGDSGYADVDGPPRSAEPRVHPDLDRNPAARHATWSARNVPWWEDFGPDGRQAPPRQRSQGAPRGQPSEAQPPGRGGQASAAEPGRGADAAPGRGADAAPGRGADAAPGRVPEPNSPASGAREGRPTRNDGTPPEPARGDTSSPPDSVLGQPEGPEIPGSRPPDFDVYSRSSGAAWSQAARAHFRRADHDLPRRGVFRQQGTQHVTGATARRVAEEEARHAAREADDLLRARPGGAFGARQAFTHDERRGPADAASPRQWSESSMTSEAPAARPAGMAGSSAAAASASRPAGLGVRRTIRRAVESRGHGPTPRERVVWATLAWLPGAVAVVLGLPRLAGCAPGAASCPPWLEPGQAVIVGGLLLALLAVPRAAYAGAVGTLAAVAVGLPLLLVVALGGLLNRLAIPVAMFMGLVVLAAYLGGTALGWRDGARWRRGEPPGT